MSELNFADDAGYFSAAEEMGLTKQEATLASDRLGRRPNRVELGMISAMWSEHCSYKSSRHFLKRLPTEGPAVLQGPGENAGVVELGEGLAVCFKIESHNHPSYIEPYQGAATGVGGILRDIFTMGARPIAFMNSLRFGNPDDDHMRYLVKGVVRGIGGYGNCVGIPTLGGEVYFHPAYQGNILVNAFCAGVVEKDKIVKSAVSGVGNPVIYLGSKTGRDGIHGASMASDSLSEEALERRPTVQVGDPFTGKLVMEATLEIIKKGLVVGIQDMGAAGLTCSCCEMSDKGGLGMEIDLEKVPVREEHMQPFEFMLSESQERMLLVCEPENQAKVIEIAERWGVDAVQIGTLTEGDTLTVRFNGETVAQLKPGILADDAPVYERPRKAPAQPSHFSKKKSDVTTASSEELLCDLLSSPNISSRKWVYSQYDQHVGSDVVSGPGGDAGVLRFKGKKLGLAMTSNCNSTYCMADPRLGAKIAVAESARNLACTGALPLAVTNCLNFGNPERPEIMWQFEQTIEGMREACLALETPVISGNVSFYNQHDDKDIPPTPVIAMCGRVDDVKTAGRSSFQQTNQRVFLVGNLDRDDELTGEVARLLTDPSGFPACPAIDLEFEKKLQQFVREAVVSGTVATAHDVSEGGIMVALAEACNSELSIGAKLNVPSEWNSLDLFSEEQSRVVVALDEGKVTEFLDKAKKFDIPTLALGETQEGQFVVEGHCKLSVEKIDQLRAKLFARIDGEK